MSRAHHPLYHVRARGVDRLYREKYGSMLPEFLPEMDLDTFVNVVALEIEE